MFGIVNEIIRHTLFWLGNCHLFEHGPAFSLAHNLDLDLVEPITNGALTMAQLSGLFGLFHGLADLFVCGTVLIAVAFCLARYSQKKEGSFVRGLLGVSMVLFGFAYALLLPFGLVGLAAYFTGKFMIKGLLRLSHVLAKVFLARQSI